eukprot:m.183591 g.183591  ORF g.183591 m.183591 type:complete len:138 (-) comp15546_c0_seq9:2619-3032(-)
MSKTKDKKDTTRKRKHDSNGNGGEEENAKDSEPLKKQLSSTILNLRFMQRAKKSQNVVDSNDNVNKSEQWVLPAYEPSSEGTQKTPVRRQFDVSTSYSPFLGQEYVGRHSFKNKNPEIEVPNQPLFVFDRKSKSLVP